MALPPIPQGKDYSRRSILFIGVDWHRKGGPLALEAFAKVKSHFPDAELHIVGANPTSIPSGQSKGVTVHGFLHKSDPKDKAKLLRLFHQSSLLILPSLYEPFGIAPIEAMLHQVPPIVTGEWALKETVAPGKTGDHAKVGDADSWAETIIRHLEDPDHLQTMGVAGREQAQTTYTWQNVAARIKSKLTALNGRS